jgi:putative FmdB family regulatory protein
MPLYEFRCTRCDEMFEEIVRNREQADEVVCPVCGAQVTRLQSGFATIGTGAEAAPASAPACSSSGRFT